MFCDDTEVIMLLLVECLCIKNALFDGEVGIR